MPFKSGHIFRGQQIRLPGAYFLVGRNLSLNAQTIFSTTHTRKNLIREKTTIFNCNLIYDHLLLHLIAVHNLRRIELNVCVCVIAGLIVIWLLNQFYVWHAVDGFSDLSFYEILTQSVRLMLHQDGCVCDHDAFSLARASWIWPFADFWMQSNFFLLLIEQIETLRSHILLSMTNQKQGLSLFRKPTSVCVCGFGCWSLCSLSPLFLCPRLTCVSIFFLEAIK